MSACLVIFFAFPGGVWPASPEEKLHSASSGVWDQGADQGSLDSPVPAQPVSSPQSRPQSPPSDKQIYRRVLEIFGKLEGFPENQRAAQSVSFGWQKTRKDEQGHENWAQYSHLKKKILFNRPIFREIVQELQDQGLEGEELIEMAALLWTPIYVHETRHAVNHQALEREWTQTFYENEDGAMADEILAYMQLAHRNPKLPEYAGRLQKNHQERAGWWWEYTSLREKVRSIYSRRHYYAPVSSGTAAARSHYLQDSERIFKLWVKWAEKTKVPLRRNPRGLEALEEAEELSLLMTMERLGKIQEGLKEAESWASQSDDFRLLSQTRLRTARVRKRFFRRYLNESRLSWAQIERLSREAPLPDGQTRLLWYDLVSYLQMAQLLSPSSPELKPLVLRVSVALKDESYGLRDVNLREDLKQFAGQNP